MFKNVQLVLWRSKQSFELSAKICVGFMCLRWLTNSWLISICSWILPLQIGLPTGQAHRHVAWHRDTSGRPVHDPFPQTGRSPFCHGFSESSSTAFSRGLFDLFACRALTSCRSWFLRGAGVTCTDCHWPPQLCLKYQRYPFNASGNFHFEFLRLINLDLTVSSLFFARLCAIMATMDPLLAAYLEGAIAVAATQDLTELFSTKPWRWASLSSPL